MTCINNTQPFPTKRCHAIRESHLVFDIRDLIDIYNKDYAKPLTDAINSLKSITDYVCGRHNDTTSGISHYKRNSHQARIKKRVIEEMIVRLSDIDKKQFDDFEQLRDHVNSIRIPGYADLCVYDFALRYGHHHNIHPQNKVYLHAGALKGAKALHRLGLIRNKITTPSMRIESFDNCLQKLGAMHLENFLCIFHKQFSKL